MPQKQAGVQKANLTVNPIINSLLLLYWSSVCNDCKKVLSERMIRRNPLKSRRHEDKVTRFDTSAAMPSKIESRGVGGYGPAFWFAYTANLFIMIAVAILFRYADLVTSLGGTEFHLGWIVGIGTVGSLFTRLALGSGIDRNGPRLVWMGSALLFGVPA